MVSRPTAAIASSGATGESRRSMNLDKLRALVAQGESETFEFTVPWCLVVSEGVRWCPVARVDRHPCRKAIRRPEGRRRFCFYAW